VPQRSDFVEHLLELLAGFGTTQARRMFGGVGIFRDDLMFGLVSGDVLYLKADDTTRHQFESRGLKQFSYVRQGKPCHLSYYEVPAAALDDADTMQEWASQAYAVARHANKDKLR
jgi:DNA transformation protein